MGNLTSILLLFILAAISIVGYFLKDLPKLYRELRVEKYKSSNERNLQVEAFYKQIKGSEIDEAFKYWTSLLMDMDNALAGVETDDWKNTNIQMIQTVFMYGSEQTVSILTAMMQYQYNNSETAGTNQYSTMLYMAYLACSLKKDFTGHEIEPMNLLELKITDINTVENKQKVEQALKNVKKDLQKYGVKS